MNAFGDVRAELAAKLVAAGAPATTDPRASPPAVIIEPARVDAASGIGAWSCVIPVVIYSPPPGDAASLAWLETELQRCLVTLGFARADYTTGGLKDVPLYRLEYVLDVPNPTC